ncbi:hypothetical protein [Streptomyces alfalfae]|nr:hypothetical protein [Streptomyces alfalfae]QUI32450.1 hypothetical protein H9W91_17465 [Streptomyces alfalfae]
MPDKPSAYEYARILGIGAMATLRGDMTDRQKRALAKLAERTAKRENRR